MGDSILIQIFLFCDNVCDISKSYNFLKKHIIYLFIQFSDSACDIPAEYKGSILYQSLVVSIETKKNNVKTIQILIYKHIILLEVLIVFKLFFLLAIAASHNFPVSSFKKLAVYLPSHSNFPICDNVCDISKRFTRLLRLLGSFSHYFF